MSDIKLLQGNCLDHLQLLQSADAILSDPPYDCKNNCNYTRFTSGGKKYQAVIGDDKPFDPSPWLSYKKAILFGFQFFADRLPVGTTLVWVKKRETNFGKFLSDAELAWMKGGKGVYVFNHIWAGADRETERGNHLHPTQKPVALMEWAIDKLKLPEGATIVDPYMGSGSVGVAAVNKGFNFIGCELDEGYFNIASERIRESQKLAPD